ncbi:MAG: 4'-phosphopantetheinyl transferase superfamily protein, partial [Gammaproteobacteria bacterium]
ALSAYVDIDPSYWQFSSNQHGRPEISAPDIAPPLRFNLTHTTGLVACVVTLEVDCGIDVERLSRRGKSMAIAEKMFAVSEQQALRRLDGEAFQDRFFVYWTLREAYCKALGVGIANAGKDYCFVEQDSGQWEIRFDRPSNDASRHWQLATMKPTDEHVMALAIRTAGMADRSIIREFVMP